MTRRPKTNRVPRTRADNEWTEAAFWGFLRSGLRLMSRRWPPRKNAKVAARRRYDGPNKRQKWEYQCVECHNWFPDKLTQVDHKVPCGTLTCFDDLPGFVERLFCDSSHLGVLCEGCHDAKHERESESDK